MLLALNFGFQYLATVNYVTKDYVVFGELVKGQWCREICYLYIICCVLASRQTVDHDSGTIVPDIDTQGTSRPT